MPRTIYLFVHSNQKRIFTTNYPAETTKERFVDTNELKKETANTVSKVKDTIKNVEIKKLSRSTLISHQLQLKQC